jgi:hypothetical protein
VWGEANERRRCCSGGSEIAAAGVTTTTTTATAPLPTEAWLVEKEKPPRLSWHFHMAISILCRI